MKIALVGSSGYIAEFIYNRIVKEPDVESILRLDRDNKADRFIDLYDPNNFDYDVLRGIDFIIFTAAISSPDLCAKDFDTCWNINVTGTAYFIKEAIMRGCRVLFFSSDAVFGDIPGMVYDEESETNANTPYGIMKKTIEDEFKGNPLFKAIRLSYVASAKDRFVTYCLNCLQKGEIASVFHPFYRNVIVVSDVVDVISFFIFHWDEYKPTFLNVAGRELVSRVRIVDEINRLMGGRLKYIITRPSEEFFSVRPSITQMKSIYIQKYGIIPDNTFTEKLFYELEEIRK